VKRWGGSAAVGALCAASALGLLGASAAPVTAAGSGAPGLRAVHPNPQGYFEYRLSPAGEHVVDTAVVSNQGDAAADLLVYAADGYTSHVSGIVYGERTEPLRPAGPRARATAPGAGSPSPRLRDGKLRLDAGASTNVSFTTAVPAGTPPGDYVGGLVAENPTPATISGGGGGLQVTQRSVVAVVVHVPGAVQGGWSIGQPTIHVENGRRQVVEVPLSSTGDQLAKPALNGTLATCAGSVVERIDRKLDTFLPHSTINYPINIDDRVLPAGCYRLALDLGEPGQALTHADRDLTISDPQAQVPHFAAPNAPPGATPAPTSGTGVSPLLIGLVGGVALLLLLGNLLLLVLLRRRRRRPEPVGRGAEAGPPR